MFLNSTTVANVRKDFESKYHGREGINIRSIYQHKGLTLVRYHIERVTLLRNGGLDIKNIDVISKLQPKVGTFLADLILDSIYKDDYYVVEEIEKGWELDGVLDLYNAVWVTKADVVKLGGPQEAKGEDLLSAKLVDLQTRFNSR